MQSPTRSLFGSNWGHGFFKNKACDYCDDVLAETADVVIGDAWLPQYYSDPDGTNIVLSRRPEINRMLVEAAESHRLKLEAITPEETAQSQDAGLRHRREGLKYRLHKAAKRGIWTPPKRSFASTRNLDAFDRRRHDLREQIRDTSHQAFQMALKANDLAVFDRELRPLTHSLDNIKLPLPARLVHGIKRRLLRLMRRK